MTGSVNKVILVGNLGRVAGLNPTFFLIACEGHGCASQLRVTFSAKLTI
jgi:hypothetical protein